MRYYHGSAREFPDGFRLTGPATRGEMGSWSSDREAVAAAKRSGHYDDTLVYVVAGNGNPLDLVGRFAFASHDRFLYEVQPEGPLLRDMAGTIWESRACISAIILRCVYRPPTPTAP